MDITINKVYNLFKYFNDPYITNLLNDFNNKRVYYIKIILEQGPHQYFEEMQCGAPDDICIYSRNPIYLYNANSMIEIAEYIISGLCFEVQRDVFSEYSQYAYNSD